MKRLLCIGSVCALALTVAGCAPADIDDAAAQDWLAQVAAERADAPGLLGSGWGVTGTGAVTVGGSREGITLASDQPTTLSAAEIRCFGGGTASVEIEVAAETSGRGVQTDVACDEQPHRVELGDDGTPLSGVTSVRIDVRSTPVTTFYAEAYI